MDCKSIRYSRHALERMFERSIPPDDVSECIRSGEAIASYPDDSPYPTVLLLVFARGLPLHVLVAQEPEIGNCYVVTVYRPDPALWSDDFKRKRRP